MINKPLNIVREHLQTYADRGIFCGFSEDRRGHFNFVWLVRHRMEFIVDTSKHALRFKQLLPGIPARSPLHAELKNFIRQRHDAKLPAHRRIDSRRAKVSCYNRGGALSISLKVKNNQYAYGVNRIVNLVHELFVHLGDAYPDYLTENFDVPEE